VTSEQRFWSRVDTQIDGCWLWTGPLHRLGYGRTSVAGRIGYAHRLAYEMLVGPIPADLELDHRCRNRACVNPAHLEPVTHKVNMERSAHATRTHCPAGHRYDTANTRHSQGRRHCKLCNNEASRRYRARNAKDAA